MTDALGVATTGYEMYKKYVVNEEKMDWDTVGECAVFLLNAVTLGTSTVNLTSSAQALGKMMKERHLMNKAYNEYCMKFSKEELKKYLYDKLVENPNIMIRCLSADDEEVDITSNEKIETIAFDEKENISIMFLGCQTSIFAYDVEIMFIDEDSKGIYTSSDVYNNAVYEGKLREMSHEEMLNMFSEIISCFVGAEEVSMTQFDVPENKYKKYNYYEPHMFLVEVKNLHTIERISTYENITIKY